MSIIRNRDSHDPKVELFEILKYSTYESSELGVTILEYHWILTNAKSYGILCSCSRTRLIPGPVVRNRRLKVIFLESEASRAETLFIHYLFNTRIFSTFVSTSLSWLYHNYRCNLYKLLSEGTVYIILGKIGLLR